MALQGSVPITTLERAVSTDVVTSDDLINRSLAEFVKCFARTSEAGGSASVRDHMVSALRVTQSGSVLQIQPGILAQDVAANPPDVPAAGTFDSHYRFGIQFAQAALSDPWDAADRWWLLQARVVRVTTLSEQRDIFNPTLTTFALSGASLDKRYESRVETDWKAGTSTTAASADLGYAPIAAVWRPSGGGAITDADIIQLAIQFDDLTSVHTDNEIASRSLMKLQCGDGMNVPSSDCFFAFAAEIRGLQLFAEANTAVSLRSATFVDPGDIASIGTDDLWWYVYLAAQSGILPSNMYTNIDHRGAIIVSRTPPNDFGSNSSTITIPDPINIAVPGNGAAFVGCFRASGTGSNIHYINISKDGEGIIDRVSGMVSQLNQTQQYGQVSSPYNWATSGPGSTEFLPFGCHYKMRLRTDGLDVASTALAIGWRFDFPGDSQDVSDEVMMGCRDIGMLYFDLHPVDGYSGANLTVTITARTLNIYIGSTGALPNADGGTNSYQLDCVGIRLI